MGVISELKRLVEHFEGQAKCAKAIGVSQPTVANWLSGKHGVSAVTALRIELVTGGEFKAAELCPDLSAVSSVV